jgi:hypothetical protein
MRADVAADIKISFAGVWIRFKPIWNQQYLGFFAICVNLRVEFATARASVLVQPKDADIRFGSAILGRPPSP